MKLFPAIIFAIGGLQAATLYNVVALGGYGGAAASANGIAANGRTTGSGLTAGGVEVSFTGGTGTATGSTLAAQARADDVNSSGTVAGTSYASGTARATIWNGGIADEILGTESYGLGINETGDLAGARVSGSTMQAFVKTSDGVSDLGVGSRWSAAYDINSTGSATGYALSSNGRFGAFVWTAGKGASMLGTLGGSNSYGQALNDYGQVVGSSMTRSGSLHAFLYDGAMQDLGTLGGVLSAAYDINSSGQVVGYSYDRAQRSRAFVWLSGVMVDLNSLVDSNSGWTLDAAYGINGAGQIVGSGTFGGQTSAFRLDPRVTAELSAGSGIIQDSVAATAVPEPGWLAAAGLGLVFVAKLKARRRAAGNEGHAGRA